MFDRKQLADTIRETANKAGTVVIGGLAVAGVALIVALVALVIAVRVRHAG